MADKLASQDAPVEHIGAEPHPMRNLMIIIGGAAMIAIIGLFYFFSGRSDHAAVAELDQFRAAMFRQCKIEFFGGPTQPELARLYADSSRMRGVVSEQLGALNRGAANCDQVVRALRSVDFPVP